MMTLPVTVLALTEVTPSMAATVVSTAAAMRGLRRNSGSWTRNRPDEE
ncbi:hypothetical protein KXS07_03775 [Inquilinus limosus]|nr:hypothetical protein [Inquilinus limosus]